MRQTARAAILFSIISAVLAAAGAPARPTGPPAAPILRIETGMHTAAIRKFALDAENRFLATVSDDKSLRVWEPATGRLLKVIRPPIGDGNEGKLFAVAVSPDGKTIACGGWVGRWEPFDVIYVFDRETGVMRHRIRSLPPLHLAFSRDGAFLLAALGGRNGIRVYRTTDFSLAAQDGGYGGDCYGADFDPAGRIAAASFGDGLVRLYGRDFRLVAREPAPCGAKPFSVRFSPDGSKVAVGCEGAQRVEILSGEDLRPLYSTAAAEGAGDLSKVAFSADGETLYAAGTYGAGGRKLIRAWSGAGRGPAADLPAGGQTAMHLVPLKKGGLVFSASDPAFGVLDASGARISGHGSPIADYRGAESGLGVSEDGTEVGFRYAPGETQPARFSVARRAIGSDSFSPLAPPRTGAAGLTVTGWKDAAAPRLNGSPLPLEEDETSRSLAVSPDGKTFVLGTEWFVRLFDAGGKELWSVPAPAAAWNVNYSGNGRLVAAAFGDGTIRWFHARNGKELLTLFPHSDRKRWAVWTPAGYYDASPGGEDIVGWHINNGAHEAADFFPISRFRASHYRPDVVAAVLETLDEDAAVTIANQQSGRKKPAASLKQVLPPRIAILSPADGAEAVGPTVTVRYGVSTPSGEPVTAVRPLVDGRPVQVSRGVTVKNKASAVPQDAGELVVPVPDRDCEVALVAENRFAASEPAVVRVRRAGARPADSFVIRPKLYVLSVGVSNYANKDLILGLAAKDAKDFADTFQKQKGRLYRDVTARVLTDEKATRDEILDGLEWITRETTSKDVAVVFLAGHGVNDPNGTYYYLPVNADLEKLKRTGVPFSEIKTTVSSLAGKTLFFVDTCHSGNVMGKRRSVPDITGVVNDLVSAENGAVVFASSTGAQYSLEDPAWGNGAFTKALLEGMEGKADYTGKGTVSVNMLDLYLSERVKELTAGKQTPTTAKPQTVPDFPVAVLR